MARKAAAKGELEPQPAAGLSVKEKIAKVLAATKDSGVVIGVANSPEMKKWLDYEKLPTGFPGLDAITDGGFPKGKYTIIAGPEQSCKTTLCLYTIAHNHKTDPNSIWVWVDAENAFDTNWAKKIGVDLNRLIVIKPAIMEDLMQLVIDAIGSGILTGIVVDSVGALTPLAEIKKKKDDKSMTKTLTDDTVAALAKKIGQFFRMANELVFKTNTCCILIGHVYTPIGDDYIEYVVKGGNALKHWGHLRLMARRRKGGQDVKIDRKMPSGEKKPLFVAYEAVFMVDKTRQGAHQGYEVSIPFVFGKGLSNVKSVIDMAFVHGIIQIGGAWCSHPSLPDGKVQGRTVAEKFFSDNPEAFSKLLAEVGEHLAKVNNLEGTEIPKESNEDSSESA